VSAVSHPAPDVSVVFETENEGPKRRIRLADVMAAWRRQTRAERVLEWIVVSQRFPTTEEERLMEGVTARWLHRPDLRYFDQKRHGVLESRGRYVALADSDARPADDWLERGLEILDPGDPKISIVTGRTRYLPGPFFREVTIAQLPNQQDSPRDTTHFLAHNALLRAEAARKIGFEGGHIRLGASTDLAERLLAAGYRVRYDPRLSAVHNYAVRFRQLWKHFVVIGYSDALFRSFREQKHPNLLWEGIGRMRVLARRLQELHRPVGIPLVRVPLSLLFFLYFSAAHALGSARARRGASEPFAEF
jgi:GT2 family glycosyltransferase